MKLDIIGLKKNLFWHCFYFVWYKSLEFLSLVQTLKISLSVRKRLPFALARTLSWSKHQCTSSLGVQDWEDVKKEHTVDRLLKIEEGVKDIIFTKKYTPFSLLQIYLSS